jgi:poly(3-hydroxybutyrate) depolymerase
VPTIVDMPYAGHTAMIAHFQKGQSLIEMLLANGLNRIFLTGWKSATEDMKDLGSMNTSPKLMFSSTTSADE